MGALRARVRGDRRIRTLSRVLTRETWGALLALVVGLGLAFAAQQFAADSGVVAPNATEVADTVRAENGSPGSPLVRSIWTIGGQAEVDACHGAVDIENLRAYLGAELYATEHWHCGGSDWAGMGVGSRVAIVGYGEYEVVEIVGGLTYGADASALPSGFDAYYQTCIEGDPDDMRVWMLTRIV